MISVLRSLSATLSACVFQSLVCEKEDGDTNLHELSHSRGSSPIQGRPDVFPGAGKKSKPTSSPNKWPGVRLLRSLLITEAKDNASKLKVLLCETCVSIYLSLLAIAWCENDPNQLYYIICNSLTTEMWGITFGGGRKVKERNPLSPDDSRRQSQTSTAQARGTYWEAARRRWNYKLLQAPTKETKAEKKTTEHEDFIPPQLSLMQYFLQKPKVDPKKSFTYDSEASISSESEESDDAFEDDSQRVIVKMKTKKVKPLDHLDPKSYSWKLMNYAVSTLVCNNINMFLADVGLEVSDLPTVSPLLHSAIKMLEHWKQVLFSKLKKSYPPSSDFVCLFTISEDEHTRGGPTLMKYKALIDPNNTPFRSTSASANPAKRLWYTLVHKEELQKIFLEFVFGHADQPTAKADEADGVEEQAKILYKDSEAINAFCVSKINPMRVVVATMRDVLELDISNMLGSSRTYYVDEDVMVDPEKRKGDQEEFTMIYQGSGTETGQLPYLGLNVAGQCGNGASMMLKRNVTGVKRMEEHPNLPYYLTGGHDGSLRMWEFGHEREIAVYRDSGKYQRVTKVHFSQHGSKFGVIDFGGQLALYQSVNTANTTAFTTLKCYNKQGNDFAFLGSTSFLATAGYSSDGSNVCLWDTLLPPPGSLIHSFTCHENGAPCIVYVPGKRLLLSGGRKGNICIFDLRQRQLMQTFSAHDSDVKSIAVDESEEFFVTGSLDGDMKVWNLSAHKELLSFPGEHGKSNYQLIKLGTQGVPRICIKPGGQMFSCGGDGTLKWRQLPTKNLIVNSPF